MPDLRAIEEAESFAEALYVLTDELQAAAWLIKSRAEDELWTIPAGMGAANVAALEARVAQLRDDLLRLADGYAVTQERAA